MNYWTYFKLALFNARYGQRLTLLLLAAFFISAVSPFILPPQTQTAEFPAQRELAAFVDDYGRFANTIAQIALPLFLRDVQGLAQLTGIAITATLATHASKRLFNDWVGNNIRLGQRPGGAQTKHNMPSGHSSMAATAVGFLTRRYGRVFFWLTLPVLLLTMFSRVALHAHTIPAVFAGAFLGLWIAELFTTAYTGRPAESRSSP